MDKLHANHKDVIEPGEDLSWSAYRKLIIYQLDSLKEDVDSFGAKYDEFLTQLKKDVEDLRRVNNNNSETIEQMEVALGKAVGLYGESQGLSPAAPPKKTLLEVLTPTSIAILCGAFILVLSLFMGNTAIPEAIINKVPTVDISRPEE